MDDNERERSFIIPFIYTVFFLCVTTGGILLIFYVFFPTLSQPWHPIAALALIGSTWLFWLLTYIYSWIKLYLRRDDPPQITIRQTTRNASVSTSASATATQKGGGSPSGHQQGAKQDSEIPSAYTA